LQQEILAQREAQRQARQQAEKDAAAKREAAAAKKEGENPSPLEAMIDKAPQPQPQQ
jgi:hypothetical protein